MCEMEKKEVRKQKDARRYVLVKKPLGDEQE